MVVDNNKSVPSIMSRDVSQFSQFGSPGPFVGEKLFDEQSHTHTHIVGPIKLSTKRIVAQCPGYLYYKDSNPCVCSIRPSASVSCPMLNPSTFTDSPCVRGVWKNPKPGIRLQTKKFLA